MSGRRLRPAKFRLNGDCKARCSLSVGNIGESRARMLHEWYEMGLNDLKMEERAREAGFDTTQGTIGRHRKNHLDEILPGDAESPELADLDDLEALDAIIKRGQTQINNWKLTPSEYFKAMEMKYKISSGSSMDAMYDAMAQAGAEGEDEDSETEDRQEGVEENREGQQSLREDVLVERPAPRAEDVAPE